jgi:hypothetical protein
VKSANNLQGAGGALVGLGMAFLVVAMNGRAAFIGVGMAFLALGIAYLARPSRDC